MTVVYVTQGHFIYYVSDSISNTFITINKINVGAEQYLIKIYIPHARTEDHVCNNILILFITKLQWWYLSNIQDDATIENNDKP